MLGTVSRMAKKITGWVQVTALTPGADEVRVRARRDDAGRLVITDLCIRGQRITTDTLRGISPARIAASLNSPEGDAGRGRLQRPDRGDPAAFYALVAVAYGQYAVASKAPAKLIAEEAGVPVSTAHRWVREARRRGSLPAGRKGRAG